MGRFGLKTFIFFAITLIAIVYYFWKPLREIVTDNVNSALATLIATIIGLISMVFDLPWVRHAIMSLVDSLVKRSPVMKEEAMMIAAAVGDQFVEAKSNLFDVSVALGLIAFFESKLPKPEGETKPNSEADGPTMKRFARCAVYASAVYGSPEVKDPEDSDSENDSPKAIAGSPKLLQNGTKEIVDPAVLRAQNQKLHDDWIRKCLNTPGQDIRKYADSEAVKDAPRLEHFIAVDNGERSVILALKGTNGIPDILKNAKAQYTEHPFWGEKYRVHSGMLASAQDLVRLPSLITDLKDCLRRHPTYGLIITGHSLGGGVAGLVTAFLAQPKLDMPDRFVTNGTTIPGREISCIAISPAASLDRSLAYRTRDMMSSIVIGYDIVPSLCHGVLEDLFKASRVLKDNKAFLVSIIKDLFPWTPEVTEEKAREYLHTLLGEGKRAVRLVPPGRVWLLAAKGMDVGEVLDVYERFGALRVASSLLDDHLIANSAPRLAQLAAPCA